jgi:DNA-binding transcriptional regulator YdaS (Cro superfamily)
MVRRAEDLEARRKQQTVRDARTGLARRIGVTAATLRNVRKRRRQVIPAWMMTAIRRVLVEVLSAEIRALDHELQLHLATSSDHRSHALDEAQARLAEARAIFEEAVR